MPTESVPMGSGRWRDVQSEMLEWSIVSVPADPGALREAHMRMLDSFLGVGDWGSGEREAGHDSPANGDSLFTGSAGDSDRSGFNLSPDEYDDLSMAMALIRDVVDGARYVGARPRPDGGDDGLADISRLVREARRNLVSP